VAESTYIYRGIARRKQQALIQLRGEKQLLEGFSITKSDTEQATYNEAQ